MKSLLALLALASAALAAPAKTKAPPVAPAPEAPLSQSDAGRKLIFSVLSGDPDSVAANLADTLRSEATPEAVQGLRSQMGWLYDLIGGDFEEFFRGKRTFDDGSVAWFREYQLSNAANKRAPIMAVQVLFPDSVSTKSVGIQVKSFLGNEKQFAGERTWKIDGRDIDIHSLVIADGGEGPLLAIMLYDPDTAALERERIGRIAVPVIREAIARGFLDSAKAANGGRDVQSTVGAVFIRRDPNVGYIHARIAFRPEEYLAGGAAAPAPQAAPAKPKAAPKAKTTKKK